MSRPDPYARAREALIVALDVPSFEDARRVIDQLEEDVRIFKVGSQLFTACGPVVVRYLLARGKQVFLDLKFHDIPNTVAGAVRAAVGLGEPGHQQMDERQNAVEFTQKGLFMCTLHTLGGEEMLRRAVEAATQEARRLGVRRPLLVGITVLTSQKAGDNIPQLVLQRALLARRAGLDGVVASTGEAAMLRRELGEDFVVVTPGIRPRGAALGDQKRVSTPRDALREGSRFLVVGRPILQAADPSRAARDVLAEMQEVFEDSR